MICYEVVDRVSPTPGILSFVTPKISVSKALKTSFIPPYLTYSIQSLIPDLAQAALDLTVAFAGSGPMIM